jgi:ferredoxin
MFIVSSSRKVSAYCTILAPKSIGIFPRPGGKTSSISNWKEEHSMKAFVDPDLCIGCTQCAGLCPEVFTMEGTLAVALLGEIPAEAVPQAVDAAQTCPVSAIQIEA